MIPRDLFLDRRRFKSHDPSNAATDGGIFRRARSSTLRAARHRSAGA